MYKFTIHGILNSHIEAVHEKVKYPCNQKVHTCNYCEYKSKTQGSLNSPIEEVHESW